MSTEKRKLTRTERKQIEAAIARANQTDKKHLSAQDSIPYQRIFPDGICRVTDTFYTKTVQYQDIFMNAKIKKINAEYEKNAAKIAELQARQKELDKQRTELENLDIVGMVRSMGMTPEELAALIEASKNGQMAPAMTEKEETGDEEI